MACETCSYIRRFFCSFLCPDEKTYFSMEEQDLLREFRKDALKYEFANRKNNRNPERWLKDVNGDIYDSHKYLSDSDGKKIRWDIAPLM